MQVSHLVTGIWPFILENCNLSLCIIWIKQSTSLYPQINDKRGCGCELILSPGAAWCCSSLMVPWTILRLLSGGSFCFPSTKSSTQVSEYNLSSIHECQESSTPSFCSVFSFHFTMMNGKLVFVLITRQKVCVFKS